MREGDVTTGWEAEAQLEKLIKPAGRRIQERIITL